MSVRTSIALRVANPRQLERLRLRKGASIEKLSEVTGVSSASIGKACRGDRISAETWGRIYAGLKGMPDLPGFELLQEVEEDSA